MDRVSGFDPEGCRFESYYSRCSQSCSSMVEHLPYKQGVAGSNPVRTTKFMGVSPKGLGIGPLNRFVWVQVLPFPLETLVLFKRGELN